MKKNIHILATEQPSRLVKIKDTFFITSSVDIPGGTFYNICITSDEKIKEGDWFYNPNINEIQINCNSNGCKKIILTTDQKLIEAGVQEIDDTFLEWFIKNPTCDYVEVEKQMLCTNCGREYCDNLRCNGYEDKPYYEIIIPLEEPKQVICRDKFDRVIQDGYYVDVQNDGVHKVYRKEDGQLYFKPYGEEERVSNYFSNDLILIPYSTKLITDLKKEIADKKQDVFYNKKQEEPKQETLEEAKYNCEGCQGKGYLDKNDGYDYGKVVCPICINDEEPKQEWKPKEGEKVWIKVFSNWSSGKYIGYDVDKNVHLVREPKEGGGNLFTSPDILPYSDMPNEPKQETLEEAAERLSERHHYAFGQQSEFYQLGFIEGANYMVERLYSEEEVINAFNEGQSLNVRGKLIQGKEWFEKFGK